MKTDNELIAEFMGWGTSIGNSLANTPLLVYHNPERVDRVFSASELCFNSSWDWLMLVVEKIEKIGSTIVIISKATCQIQPIIYDKETDSMKWHGPFETVGTEKLKFTYETVVRFIKWYTELLTLP